MSRLKSEQGKFGRAPTGKRLGLGPRKIRKERAFLAFSRFGSQNISRRMFTVM